MRYNQRHSHRHTNRHPKLTPQFGDAIHSVDIWLDAILNRLSLANCTIIGKKGNFFSFSVCGRPLVKVEKILLWTDRQTEIYRARDGLEKDSEMPAYYLLTAICFSPSWNRQSSKDTGRHWLFTWQENCLGLTRKKNTNTKRETDSSPTSLSAPRKPILNQIERVNGPCLD